MIYPEVINHMEADDLRNLVCHMLGVEEARTQLTAAQEDAIEYLRLLHQNDQYRMDCRRRVDDGVRCLKNMERDGYLMFLSLQRRWRCCLTRIAKQL